MSAVQATNTFQRDLAIGEAVERRILSYIQERYPCAIKIEGAFKGYDIWIPECDCSIEIKTDEKSQITNNIVIEVEMFGVPSGLCATKATYWIFYDGIEYRKFRTNWLRSFILRSGYKLIPKFRGDGDTATKKVYLVPKADLFPFGTRLWENKQ